VTQAFVSVFLFIVMKTKISFSNM